MQNSAVGNSGKSKAKYNIFVGPFLAFFSKDFYADVAINWSGLGLVYMLFLVSVSWLVTSICIDKPFILVSTDRKTSEILHQLPNMTIAQGKLSIDKPYPYHVVDPDTKNEVMLFTKDRQDNVALDTDPSFVVTETALLSKGSDRPIVEFNQLSSASAGAGDTGKLGPFSGEHIIAILSQLTFWTPVFIFVVGILPVWILHVLQMLFFGAVAMGICGLFKQSITYGTGMRLAAAAMAPVILISTALTALTEFSILPQVESFVFPSNLTPLFTSPLSFATSVFFTGLVTTGLIVLFLVLAGAGIKQAQSLQS